MARVLILRRRAEAERTAEALAARGHAGLILPVETIEPLAGEPPVRDVAGFVVTSANALAPLAAAFPNDARPLLAVGERTADAARQAGFAAVTAGDGSWERLAAAARELAASDRRPLLYAAGRVRSAALEDALAAAGIALGLWEVYDTRTVLPDRQAIAAALGGGAPEAVLLLSAGQARAFADLVGRHGALFQPRPRLLCLSDRIRDALPQSLVAQAVVSPSRKLSSLFDCFL